MKVKSTSEGTFRPITLEITIESEAELHQMYARFNVAFTHVVGSFSRNSERFRHPLGEKQESISKQACLTRKIYHSLEDEMFLSK